MTDEIPFPPEPIHELDRMIACADREVKMRARVYPRWVAAGKMKQDKADSEIKDMMSVLAYLRRAMREAERYAAAHR